MTGEKDLTSQFTGWAQAESIEVVVGGAFAESMALGVEVELQ